VRHIDGHLCGMNFIEMQKWSHKKAQKSQKTVDARFIKMNEFGYIRGL
jgi:hypothetical protein